MKVTGTSDNRNLAINAAEYHGDNPKTSGIASATRQQVSPLLNLPEEIYARIIGNLGLNDLCILARSCKRMNNIINNSDALCKAWFSRFPSRVQTQFKAIANNLSDRDLRGWLGQFTREEAIADDIIARRTSIYFPQCLFFTVSRLMEHCPTFNAVKKTTVLRSYFSSVPSSPDGRHVLTASEDGSAQILSRSEDGQWTQKTTVSHGREVSSAIFSADSRHMATTIVDNTIQIWSWEDGKWAKKTTFSHAIVGLVAFNFSANSCDMVISCLSNTAQIWGLGKDGQWTQKAILSHDVFIVSATFSADGRRMATAGGDTAQIFARDKNGQWSQEAILSQGCSIYSATFSTDGCYVMTISSSGTVQIWGLVKDREWTQKATLTHDDMVFRGSFSADATHIVTATSNKTFIWGRSEDGQWTNKATVAPLIRMSSWALGPSPEFSADGHHVLIKYDGHHVVFKHEDVTVDILNLGKDGQWTKQTLFHRKSVNSASFSPDGRHVVTASTDGTAKIWGRGQDGKWACKANVSHSYDVYSASFSPDGRHVVTGNKDKTAQIWGQRENGQWTWKAAIAYCDNPCDCTENPHTPHYRHDKVNFTADGRHVVIRHAKRSENNEVQIWAIHL